MSVQWTGVLLASVTFATIGVGHVLVRHLHARYGTRPALPFSRGGRPACDCLLTGYTV